MPSGTFKHSYKTRTRESLPIAIYNAGVQQCTPSYTWGPGVRDHFLIHHVISGSGSYTAGGVTWQLHAGDTFIVYPSAVAAYSASAVAPWEYCWVGFNGAEAGLMLSQTPFSPRAPVVRFAQPDAIRDAVTAIYRASGTTPSSELRAIGMLYLFLALLMDQAPPAASTNDLSLQYVESGIRFIAHNYSRRIGVDEIAASVGISRSHLYRVFMRQIDTSPNEYLTRYRVSQASELLERSTLPVSAVAASVGYEDQLYFSRVFKKVMGMSPTAYQKKAGGG